MCFRLSLAVIFLVAASAQAQEKYRVYLGTYTDNVSKGIYQCELNLKDGSLSAATLAGETASPSFLAFHPNKKFLYAVNEEQATVSAFAIDGRALDVGLARPSLVITQRGPFGDRAVFFLY